MTSQVPGVPLCPHAPLYDPDGAAAPDPCGAAVLPSALPIALASILCLSKLDLAACWLPVYASQPRSP